MQLPLFSLPFKGRAGVGWVCWSMQPLPNRLEDTIEVIEHLVVPESQHAKPCLLQKRRAYSVGLDIFRVLAAVQLDNEPSFQADEIHDVVTERVLAPEFAAIKLPSAKTAPEQALRFSGPDAQPALQSWAKNGGICLAFHLQRPATIAISGTQPYPIPTQPSP